MLTSCRNIWTFGLNAWLQTSPTLQTRENGRTGLDQENKISAGAEETLSGMEPWTHQRRRRSFNSQSVGFWKPAWTLVPLTSPSPPSCWCMLLTARSSADEGLVRFMFAQCERGTAQTVVCEKTLAVQSSTSLATDRWPCLGFYEENKNKGFHYCSAGLAGSSEKCSDTEFLDFSSFI